MLLSVGIISVALVVLVLKYLFGSSGPNPFEKDTRVPVKPIVHNRKEKNKVLKQGELNKTTLFLSLSLKTYQYVIVWINYDRMHAKGV